MYKIIKLEKNKMISFIIPFISIFLSIIIGMIVIGILGANPFEALKYLFIGAFGNASNIGTTLLKSTPLIFTSLCVVFAYKCGIYNLGGEGQFIIGSIATCVISLKSGIMGLPGIIIGLLGGLIIGGIWGLIPAILKIYRGQSELIITIMMNYIATLFMGVIYTNWLRDSSVPQTVSVDDSLKLGRVFPNMRFSWGFIIAVIIGILIYIVLYNTSMGFKLRAVGINSTASRYNGYPVKKLMILCFVISGAIGGLGGGVELLGSQYRLINGYGAGFGFDGVAIALIAQLNPLASIVVAIFFAALRTGSTTMQAASGVPSSISNIIQALVIIFTVGAMALIRLPKIKALISKKKEAN